MPEVVTTLSGLANGAGVVAPPPVPVIAPSQPTLVAPRTPPKGSVAVSPKPPVAPPKPPPPPSRPAREEPAGPSGKGKRAMVIVGAVVTAAVLGGLVATLLSTKSPDTNTGQSAASQVPTATVTVQPPPGSTPPSSAPSSAQSGSEGAIDWGQAGQLVIDYFGSAAPAARWAMLTPEAQQAYGSADAFQEYWAAYPQLSSRNARNVRLNGDGSVTVPVDVTYASGNQQHKEIRVVKVGGQVKIASDTK
jgi:hypothetical protein